MGKDTKDDARWLFNLSADGDLWGNCMAHWFGIAHALYFLGHEIPDHWEFSPGTMRGVLDNWPDAEYVESLESGSVDPATLRYFGDVLCRYSRLLRHKGLDY